MIYEKQRLNYFYLPSPFCSSPVGSNVCLTSLSIFRDGYYHLIIDGRNKNHGKISDFSGANILANI